MIQRDYLDAISEGGTSMLGWCAETTLVAGGLALVAMLASRLRSMGPTLRHLLWLVVLIKLATPPLFYWPWAISWQFLDRPLASPGREICVLDSTTADEDRAPLAGYRSEPPCVIASLDEPNLSGKAIDTILRRAPEIEPIALAATPRRPWFVLPSLPGVDAWIRFAVPAWLVGSVVLAVGQGFRIIQFRRRLRAAVPGPDRLVAELDWIAKRLGAPVPEMLVVPDLGTPLLWCLGRPRLLLPARLVKTLPLERWRGILTHELAHLRRGDHWVSRLELAAGLFWWWNPLYWLVRARLDTEAELACDAWVVWALPKERVAYAEVLLDVCALLSLSMPPSPALGVAGSGRFFERRLTLILHDHVPCRLSPLGVCGACLLLLFAVPSWSKAEPAAVRDDKSATISVATTTGENTVADDDPDDADDDKKIVRKNKADDDDDDADDDDDDDDEDDDKDDDDDQSRLKEKAKKKKADRELEIDLGLDSDFEKKVEELGEKIGKEMEAKFGPGSEFEKKMEALGKELEAKFGEDSEFAKKMEAFGKEMEAKFGAGSEFEKKMKDLGEGMKKKYGPGSEFAKNLKDKVDVDVKAVKKTDKTTSSAKARAELDSAQAAKRKVEVRDIRIKKLEAQVRELIAEIKALKAGESEE